MKKILFAVFIIALGSVVAQAQGFGFSIGPKIGFNSNTLTDNRDSISANIKNSFQIGAFVRVGSKVYFQPEINYQVSKGSLDRGAGIAALSQKYTLKTIKIPALIGVKLIKKGPVNLRVMAGPAFTFVIDKQIDPAINGLWPIQSRDDLKNSNVSVQMGAGLDVLFMTLDVRYEFGVNNMYNGNSGYKMKTNVFNISLGVKLL